MFSPKRSTQYLTINRPRRSVVIDTRSFKSQEKWDSLLSSDLKLSEKFESVKRTIYGIGFTCVVIMGVDKCNREEVAIKVIMKSKLHSEDELRRARFELEVHTSLTNRYILPFLAAEETVDSLILVTPLAFGDLNSLTAHKVMSEGNCRNLCHQLLLGLDYLHNEAGLMHCDIKPANILVFKIGLEFVAKICDFGFAEPYVGELLPYNGLRGSLGYFAPEQLTHQDFGTGVDLFALGIITYTLLCGYEPFYPSNKCAKLMTNAEILQFDSPYWDSVSSEAQLFVRGLLQGDPMARMSAKEALNSVWITKPTRASEMVFREDADFQFKDPRKIEIF